MFRQKRFTQILLIFKVKLKKYKVDLVRAPRIGIRLEGEKENIQHMLRDLQKDNLSEDEKYTPEYRRLWILKKVLIDCETITLESVSKEFLVSKTSLYQDIAVINKSIESQSDVNWKLENVESVFRRRNRDTKCSEQLFVIRIKGRNCFLILRTNLETFLNLM